MSDKPNVTVIYQDAKQPSPSLGTIIVEVIVFLLFVFVVGSGCLLRWWL